MTFESSCEMMMCEMLRNVVKMSDGCSCEFFIVLFFDGLNYCAFARSLNLPVLTLSKKVSLDFMSYMNGRNICNGFAWPSRIMLHEATTLSYRVPSEKWSFCLMMIIALFAASVAIKRR